MEQRYFVISGPRIRKAYPNSDKFLRIQQPDGTFVEGMPFSVDASAHLNGFQQALMFICNISKIKSIKDIEVISETEARWQDFTITMFHNNFALAKFILSNELVEVQP